MPDAAATATTPETRTDLIRRAEIRVPTSDFDGDMRCFIDALGFRLDRIWPADYPSFAALSGHGAAIVLERSTDAAPVALRLYADDPAAFAGGRTSLTTPGGHRIAVEAANPPLVIPETSHGLVVRRLVDSESWIIGRAGMRYRDLLPERLGGAIIASHIRIADAGPVADMVHYHTVGFQLIFCHRGWVRLVYEDQGPPFVLYAGDCVIQPPEIRHRVLEASAGVEVIEIGVPAEHLTSIDHEMELPTPHFRPEREFHGTKFVLHREAEATWEPWRIPGFEMRETGIGAATKGLAGVHVARRIPGTAVPATRHGTDILFGFVRTGSMTLDVEGHPRCALAAGDAFVLPPHLRVAIGKPSDDLEILEVALPASFATEIASLAGQRAAGGTTAEIPKDANAHATEDRRARNDHPQRAERKKIATLEGLMAAALAHQRTSVYWMNRLAARPLHIHWRFFNVVSLGMLLVSIEQSLRFRLLLHYDIAPVDRKGTLHDLYEAIESKSASQAGRRSDIVDKVNEKGATRGIPATTDEEVATCLRNHESAHTNLRSFRFTRDGALNPDFGVRPREVQILHCLGLGLIELNMDAAKNNPFQVPWSMSIRLNLEMPTELGDLKEIRLG